MEKEKKGLFGRLLDFWKEKIAMGQTDSIGFWNDMEAVENHFAEMGAVASLSQEETRKAFWEETAAAVAEGKREEWERPAEERKVFFVPTEEKTEKGGAKEAAETSAEKEAKRRIPQMFAAEVFQNGGRETETTEKSGLGRAFLWEMPEEEKAARSIIPVAEEAEHEEEAVVETVQVMRTEEAPKREEKTAENQIDIEKLMRQMTKKLWEEREGCGRRLR